MWNKHYNYDANKIISSVNIFTFTFYLFSFWACEATNGLMYCNCITSCLLCSVILVVRGYHLHFMNNIIIGKKKD